MKCINKSLIISLVLIFSIGFTGCGKLEYDLKYNAQSCALFSYASDEEKADTFASNLCVTDNGLSEDEYSAKAMGLFDLNNKETIYAKNVHERLYPASITKIMTAIVALKYGSLDQILTASERIYISESGAQVINLKPGDTMTLSQALHILLIYSANDVANLIAENIGGSIDGFVDIMNDEAYKLGATNTHFKNPHGLSDDEHYTTVYDLYLIFNEAVKYDVICEIIHMNNYNTTYHNAMGEPVEFECRTTNLFLRDDYDNKSPSGVTVIGGKTGTTNAAGHCLLLLSKDDSGAPYISVILCDSQRETLYSEMSELLEKIN
ncbi:MAG: serine hydrolase [Lachnospiraceae bacterium]|nr:serine hydrolase [Lachnospiraceae bacterium]